jgi:hypothetical protein
MEKMFVRYSGNVAAFKAAGLETTYNKSIVFIGDGEAVYTHGKYYGDVKAALAALEGKVDGLHYFSKISDGTTTAAVGEANGTITFSADDPASVAIKVDNKGVHIGLEEAFVTKVNDTASGLAGEISRATEAEGKLRTDLGQKTDEANAEGSAFARIAQLKSDLSAMTGGNGSISEQIKNAINNLDVDATAGDFVASISQEDGKIVPVMGTFNFDEAGAAATAKSEVIGASGDASSADTVYGAKKYAEEKASAAESAAKSYAEGLVAEGSALEARVKANEDALVVLNGEGDGSVKKAVAEGIASVVANANEDFDTLKEVADWIANDTTGAAKMQSDIAKLTGADTVDGSVAKQVKDAVAAEAAIARAAEQANAANIATEKGRVDAIVADYLKAADKTELSNAINGKVAQADYDAKVAELAKADSDNLAAAKKYADDAIAALDVTDEAVAGQFVTAVSETDGKISVSRASVNASQISITNTETDAFAASTQNVQDALTELASFWAWEEL